MADCPSTHDLIPGYGQHAERCFGGHAILRDQRGPGKRRREIGRAHLRWFPTDQINGLGQRACRGIWFRTT